MSRRKIPEPKHNPVVRRLYLWIEKEQITKEAAYKRLREAGMHSSFVAMQKWLRGVNPSKLHEMDLQKALRYCQSI